MILNAFDLLLQMLVLFGKNVLFFIQRLLFLNKPEFLLLNLVSAFLRFLVEILFKFKTSSFASSIASFFKVLASIFASSTID